MARPNEEKVYCRYNKTPMLLLLGAIVLVAAVLALYPGKLLPGLQLECKSSVAFAEEPQEEIEWKTWKEFGWYVDQEGTLVISSESHGGPELSWYGDIRITSARFEPGTRLWYYCRLSFSGLVNLRYIDFSNISTTQLDSTAAMFSGCSSLESVDLSWLDTKKSG